MATTRDDDARGLEYTPGVIGKQQFRISEQYVAEHVVPLIRARRPDTVKLDLVLRGIALSPQHTGRREPGIVLRHRERLDYPALHDLVRNPRRFSTGQPDEDDDPVVRDNKREWVREQLKLLEDRKLLVRRDMGDGRRQIVMLCDLGDSAPFDDPGAKATYRPYVTVLGNVLADPGFREWGSPEIAGYLCAMVADRYARNAEAKRGIVLPPGMATWFRQAEWFNNQNGYRLDGQVVLPFSTTTIERGLAAMRRRGYVVAERKKRSPSGKRLLHPRLVYTNKFADVGSAKVIDLVAHLSSA